MLEEETEKQESVQELVKECYDQSKYIFVGQKLCSKELKKELYRQANDILRFRGTSYYFSTEDCKALFLAAVYAKQDFPDDTNVIPCVREKIYLFDQSVLENVISVIESAKATFIPKSNEVVIRYNVDSIKCHSLTTKESIFAFFDVCNEIYHRDFDGFYDDSMIDEDTADRIVESIHDNLFYGSHIYGSSAVQSDVSQIEAGLKVLTLPRYRKYFIRFMECVFSLISTQERRPIQVNDYIDQLFVDWNKNNQEKKLNSIHRVFSDYDESIYRERTFKFNQFDENAKLNISLTDDGVVIEVPSFKISSSGLKICCEIKVNGETNEKFDVETSEGVITSPHSLAIQRPLKSLVPSNSEDINFEIIISTERIIYLSEKVHVDFLLFDVNKKIVNIERDKPNKIQCDAYYFIYTNHLTSLFDRPNMNAWRFGQNLNVFSFKPCSGEHLSSKNYDVYFVDLINDKENKPCFVFDRSNNLKLVMDDKTYQVAPSIPKVKFFNGESTGGFLIRINGEKVGKRLSNSYCYDENHGLYDLSTLIQGNNEPTRLDLCNIYGNVLDSLYYIKDTKIEYNRDFYFADENSSIKAKLIYSGYEIMEKEFPIIDGEEVNVYFDYPPLGGKLIGDAPGVFSFKLSHIDLYKGKTFYHSLGKVSRDDLTNNFTISFYPESLPVSLFIDNQEIYSKPNNPNTFELGIHLAASNNLITNVKAKVDEREINIMNINDSLFFDSVPFSIDCNRLIFYWEPSKHLKSNLSLNNLPECNFNVQIYDDEGVWKQTIFELDFNDKEIHLNSNDYPFNDYLFILTCEGFLKHEYENYYFLGSDKQKIYRNRKITTTRVVLENGVSLAIKNPFTLKSIKHLVLSSDSGEPIYTSNRIIDGLDQVHRFKYIRDAGNATIEMSHIDFMEIKEGQFDFEVRQAIGPSRNFVFDLDKQRLVLSSPHGNNNMKAIKYFICEVENE